MPVTLCVLLSAAPGREQMLVEYEDQVLQRVTVYGGRVLQRVRAIEPVSPFEVHVLEFPTEDALMGYMADPERVALAPLRDEAIVNTDVIRVEVV